jgi:hypothetical protein
VETLIELDLSTSPEQLGEMIVSNGGSTLSA